jgi:hypothetical protein
MSPGRHVLYPPQEEELMFTSVLNRTSSHRRFVTRRKRGPIATGMNPVAVVYVLSLVAMIVSQAKS